MSVALIILALWMAAAVVIATLWALIGLGLRRGRCTCVVCEFRSQMLPPVRRRTDSDAAAPSTTPQADQRRQP